MAPVDPFVSRLLALMLPLGPVEARRLFGGHGLYLEGTIFALIFDGALFLKADEESKAAFERRGLGPITYEGHKGKTIALPYWEAPPGLLEDGRALCRWARKAHEAGLRFNARKKPKAARTTRAAKAKAGSEGISGRRPSFKPDF
ncbi:MAG: TfoX/Sxy family protein [Alphaproteobacteria bacterium]